MADTTKQTKYYIVELSVYTNDRDFRSRFISDSAGLALLEQLDGQVIEFGEIFDEYTEVEGVFLTKNMMVEEITQEEADTLIRFVGRSLSTYFFPDYLGKNNPEDN